jgi:endo-1,4-beta-xylanase
MNVRRTGVTLLAVTGTVALLLAGVAGASPMGGGMGGSPGSSTMMQPGTGPGGPGQGNMFVDITSGDWFARMAENMAARGFMGGFSDGTFGPDQPLTRGQFAGIMARMMNLQPTAGTSFSDTEGFWGAGMIETMTQMGVLTGHADGTFGPYDSITREQMAAIMDRAWQAKHGVATSADMTAAMATMMGRLTDAEGSWAADHIAWMMQMGVINGDGFGMFRPGDMTNRAEASAMMWRWFEADQAQS